MKKRHQGIIINFSKFAIMNVEFSHNYYQVHNIIVVRPINEADMEPDITRSQHKTNSRRTNQ